MLKFDPRRNPINVMPHSSTRSIARLEGADTAATTGLPARNGLLHDLKRRAAADEQEVAGQRQALLYQHATDDLVDGVMPAEVRGSP